MALQPGSHDSVEFIISSREHGRIQRRARLEQQRQGADVILRVAGVLRVSIVLVVRRPQGVVL